MRRLEVAQQMFGRTERELAEERAAALARIAGKLERLIAELGERRRRTEALSGAARAGAVAEYDAVWRQARQYRWYLEVQRESVGLRRHDLLDTLYPVPGPIA